MLRVFVPVKLPPQTCLSPHQRDARRRRTATLMRVRTAIVGVMSMGGLGVLGFVTIAAGWPAPTLAAIPPPEDAKPPFTAAAADSHPWGFPPAYFANLWQQRQNARSRGDEKAAATLLGDLVDAKLRAGWPDAFVFGRAVGREAVAEAREGHESMARQLAEATVQLAPDDPASHVAWARTRWHTGDLWGALVGTTRAAYATWLEPPHFRAHLGNLLWVLLLGFVGAVTLFAVLVVYRHLRLVAHDLQHLLPSGATAVHCGAVLLMLLLAPIFFRVGLAWGLLIWILFGARYFSPRERAGALAACVGLALLSLATPMLLLYIAYPDSKAEQNYRLARDLNADALAQTVAQRQDLTRIEEYLLGMRRAWSGDHKEARQRLATAAKAGVSYPELHTTMGNLYFFRGEKERAVAAYEHAITQDPDDVVALFNLSRACFALTDHKRGSELYRRAAALDHRRTEAFGHLVENAGAAYMVPVPVHPSVLAAVAEADGRHYLAVQHLWRWLGGRGERTTFAGMATAAAALVLLLGRVRRENVPSACQRCGAAACKKCHADLPNRALCGACHSVFGGQSQAEQRLRIDKEIETHRYRARTRRMRLLFVWLLVGAEQMARGATLRGLILSTMFLTGIGGLMLGLRILPTPSPLYGAPGDLLLGLSGALTVGVYVTAVVDSKRGEG